MSETGAIITFTLQLHSDCDDVDSKLCASVFTPRTLPYSGAAGSSYCSPACPLQIQTGRLAAEWSLSAR